jgi:hypothetical protein
MRRRLSQPRPGQRTRLSWSTQEVFVELFSYLGVVALHGELGAKVDEVVVENFVDGDGLFGVEGSHVDVGHTGWKEAVRYAVELSGSGELKNRERRLKK